MSNKIKHEKKVINQYKVARILNNQDTMLCQVYIFRCGEAISGTGLYLNKKVYIALQTGYYSYTINETGTNKDNLAFQPLYLVTPF